jgi:peptidoglycan/xylan/chitin deacetylase (PgdA/CDA1 family)
MSRTPARTSARSRLILLVALRALAASIAPGAIQAAVSRPVRLEAGPHKGFTFTAAGAVRSSKSVVLAKPATVQSSDRVWVARRGAHFRISTGTLAGFLVRESMTAYTPGMVLTRAYAPAVRVGFPAGTYLGYRFDGAWNIASTKRLVLAAASGASISRRAVIHGRPFGEVVNGTLAGYWVPLVAPSTLTAQRLSCASPGHVAAGSRQFFQGALPGAQNQVALTFDMGGRIEPGLAIVNRLILDRVCTTFFPTGAMGATAEGQAILKLIGAHPELFEVGNHTYHHCNLRSGGGGSPTTAPCPKTRPNNAFITDEMTKAAAVIRVATGMDPAPYWRGACGAEDSGVRNAVASAGYTKTFGWDIDTIDWRPRADGGPSAAQIADKVVVNAVNGSDVLMHLGGFNTYDALPSMVQRLRARGLTPTTISQILR